MGQSKVMIKHKRGGFQFEWNVPKADNISAQNGIILLMN